MKSSSCDAKPQPHFPCEPYPIRAEEVHVWLAPLGQGMNRLQASFRILSREEQERALRFRFERDRNEFIAAHGITREILGRYASMEPDELRFETDRSGRPTLDQASGGDSIAFSMSHSGSAALFGVAQEKNIGVDIERINPEILDDDTLKRILSPPERAVLDALPQAARKDMLFRFWTLKEAYLKARGSGLAIPPSAIDVSEALSGWPIALAEGENTEGAIPWTLSVIPVPPGYAAAAAWRGYGLRLVCRLFDVRTADPVAMNGPA